MHKQGRMKILDLTQVFFGVSAMIGDRGIDLSAYGRKERHQGAEAVPLDANLAPYIQAVSPRLSECLEYL